MGKTKGKQLPDIETEYFLVMRNRKAVSKKLVKEAKDFPVLNGFGYYGVVLHNPEEDLVQCHICGLWFRSLGGHIRFHGYTASSYREDFELSKSIPLVCLDLSEIFRETAIKYQLFESIENPMYFQKGHRSNNTRTLGAQHSASSANRSEERRKKISQAKRELFSDPVRLEQQRKTLDAARVEAIKVTKGKPKSIEFRENLSRKLKGRKFSQATIEKMRTASQKREERMLFENNGRHPRRRFSEEEEQKIMALFETGKYTRKALSRMFSCSHMTINRVLNGYKEK